MISFFPKARLLKAAIALLAIGLAAQARAVEPVAIDAIVAVVNDDVVTQTELTERVTTVAQQLRQQKRPLPPEPILESQVLERLILERLQMNEAKTLGIQVEDEALNQTLQRIAADNKLSLSEFRTILEKDGYSFANFREDIRRELTIRRLHERQIYQRISVSEHDVDEYLAAEQSSVDGNKEYHLAHILVAMPEAATPAQVDKAKEKMQSIVKKLNEGTDFAELAVAYSDGQQALEGGDLGWRKAAEMPTLLAGVVPRLAENQVSEVIRGPNGLNLIKLLGVRGEQRHIVEETLARHILIATTQLVSDADATAQLDGLRSEILDGADFEALAKEHSDDKGTAREGGKLGWVKPGDTVPQFEQVMNALSPGEISTPFKTRFGWHIVQVLDRRSVDATDSKRRSQAQQALRQRKIDEETELWLRRLRDEAYVELRLPAQG